MSVPLILEMDLIFSRCTNEYGVENIGSITSIVSKTLSEIDISPFSYFRFIYVWHCSVNNRY